MEKDRKDIDVNKEDLDENDSLASYDAARAKFDRNSEIGEQNFFVKTWPAWFVNGSEKWYSPVIRLYIGDRSGNIIVEKPVVMSSLIDLIGELTDSIAGDISMASEMADYKMFIPISKNEILNDVNEISENINRIKKMLESIDVVDNIPE